MDGQEPAPGTTPALSWRLGIKLAIDFGPLLVFFAANALGGIYWGTGAFMAASAIALIAGYLIERRLEPMPLLTGALVLIFGALTLTLHNDSFIKIKATIYYGLLSAALFGGLLTGRPLIRILFGTVFQLTESGWRILTLRYAFFFASLALLNEIIWRSVSTPTWVAVKVWVFVPLVFGFSVLQAGLIDRHSIRVPDKS